MIFWLAFWIAAYDEFQRCAMLRAMPELVLVPVEVKRWEQPLRLVPTDRPRGDVTLTTGE
jgi:hypothetical protein